MDIEKRFEALSDQVNAANASIHDFRAHLKWMKDRMEGMFEAVHQLIAHNPVLDNWLDQIEQLYQEINSNMEARFSSLQTMVKDCENKVGEIVATVSKHDDLIGGNFSKIDENCIVRNGDGNFVLQPMKEDSENMHANSVKNSGEENLFVHITGTDQDVDSEGNFVQEDDSDKDDETDKEDEFDVKMEVDSYDAEDDNEDEAIADEANSSGSEEDEEVLYEQRKNSDSSS